MDPKAQGQARVIGRYVLRDEIASGGMATVHFGRLLGPVGFARTVAIKRLHPNFAKDPEFVSMFLDEARIAARVRHPNVVSTLDIVALQGELFLVMEYVQGESLARLNRAMREAGAATPPAIATGILSGVLQGLHAAHEAVAEDGSALEIVHRDVSPQNVLVGSDGVARVVDFGVAKAVGRLQSTVEGQVKGKVSYMAPEQILGSGVDRRVDIYAAAIVLWETLAGRRLYMGDNAMETMTQVLEKEVQPPSGFAPGIPPALDAVVMRGLQSTREARFSTAREMAVALESALAPATARQVGDWVASNAGAILEERALRVAEIERSSQSPRGTSLPTPLRPMTTAALAASPADENPRSAHGGVASDASLRSPRLRSKRSGTLALATGFLVVAALVVMRSSPRNVSVATATAPSTTVLAQEVAPSSSATSTAEVPTAIPPLAVVPDIGASRVPVASRTAPNAKRAFPPRPGPRTETRSCDPPYTLDPTGLHVAKPECL